MDFRTESVTVMPVGASAINGRQQTKSYPKRKVFRKVGQTRSSPVLCLKHLLIVCSLHFTLLKALQLHAGLAQTSNLQDHSH